MSPIKLSTLERLRLEGVGGKCRGYYLKREGGSLTPPLLGQEKKTDNKCKEINLHSSNIHLKLLTKTVYEAGIFKGLFSHGNMQSILTNTST